MALECYVCLHDKSQNLTHAKVPSWFEPNINIVDVDVTFCDSDSIFEVKTCRINNMGCISRFGEHQRGFFLNIFYFYISYHLIKTNESLNSFSGIRQHLTDVVMMGCWMMSSFPSEQESLILCSKMNICLCATNRCNYAQEGDKKYLKPKNYMNENLQIVDGIDILHGRAKLDTADATFLFVLSCLHWSYFFLV